VINAMLLFQLQSVEYSSFPSISVGVMEQVWSWISQGFNCIHDVSRKGLPMPSTLATVRYMFRLILERGYVLGEATDCCIARFEVKMFYVQGLTEI
jgi:hypothetical protein